MVIHHTKPFHSFSGDGVCLTRNMHAAKPLCGIADVDIGIHCAGAVSLKAGKSAQKCVGTDRRKMPLFPTASWSEWNVNLYRSLNGHVGVSLRCCGFYWPFISVPALKRSEGINGLNDIPISAQTARFMYLFQSRMALFSGLINIAAAAPGIGRR